MFSELQDNTSKASNKTEWKQKKTPANHTEAPTTAIPEEHS